MGFRERKKPEGQKRAEEIWRGPYCPDPAEAIA